MLAKKMTDNERNQGNLIRLFAEMKSKYHKTDSVLAFGRFPGFDQLRTLLRNLRDCAAKVDWVFNGL